MNNPEEMLEYKYDVLVSNSSANSESYVVKNCKCKKKSLEEVFGKSKVQNVLGFY